MYENKHIYVFGMHFPIWEAAVYASSSDSEAEDDEGAKDEEDKGFEDEGVEEDLQTNRGWGKKADNQSWKKWTIKAIILGATCISDFSMLAHQ